MKEQDLLLTLRRDTVKAFEQAYDAYSEKLLYYIYTKTGDKKRSEDILQEVFIDFWNKLDCIESSVYGYLFNSTKYQILNHYRSEKVKEKYLIHLSNFLQDINSITPQKYLEAKEIMEQIEALVAQLPPQCRKVFTMSRFEHKSNDEIAEELQISKRTVENYITKSLAFIRDHNISIYLVISYLIDREP
ncbi:RNA polymerase sigma-70 factor [Sphingobacterium faecale]|uniref:RNA polymerase sigma-70 factor n=1 Tax=Sphingobacterium faecale TaxID=2803775 RepID=A0ABS1R428_9SPHI|nr:RNA polymerase sigma-70 factor [Sphingobacterium faecale]MBL1409471.1 RNA polymerase sigma-70 factor [Sphingobacterium faecale]